ncbi:hypothetical protein JOD29_000502 [Lysinibacillus composti]|nr:hypothetical protein [Lysinibacillus composti]MBM7607265.1 hypothetical protein [Lysinibacillus composti]
MTKVVVTIDEGKTPSIERYENEIKVGNRKVTLDTLLRGFIQDAPIELVFDVLVNRRCEDMEEYFDTISPSESTNSGYKFLLTLFNQIPQGLMNDELFSDFALLVIQRMEDSHITVDELTPILSTWVQKIKEAPTQPEYLNLYVDLLQYFLGSQQSGDMEIQKELLRTLYKYMKDLKEKDKIDKLVASHIQHLPTSLLLDALKERNEGNNKVVYGFTNVPKNASYIATTSKGTTYFYDIPKTKMRVKFQDVPFEDVGHPRLLFAISIDKSGAVYSLKLAALKGKKPLAIDTPLYHYPYSNVYKSGAVCWSGFRELPIDQIPLMFLSTPNNNHLNDNTLSLFEKYKGKNFPDTRLIEMNAKVEDWC